MSKTLYFRYDRINKNDSVDTIYEKLVFNTGNLVYDAAISQLFDCNVADRSVIDKINIDNYSKIIIMDLCYISNVRDFSFLVPLFEKCKKKGIEIVPLSVGVQRGFCEKNYTLPDQQRYLLKILEEMGTIATRGNFTAEVLEKNNIKNVKVVGCPSFFINKDTPFWFKEKDNIEKNDCICNYHKILPSSNTYLLQYFYENSQCFIEQQIKYFDTFDVYKKVFSNSILNFFINKAKIFYNYQEWKSFLDNNQFYFSFGPRMHGNVMSILSGIKSLVIVNDERKKELCEYAKIPFILSKDFDISKSISYYYDKADYSSFISNYSTIWSNFKDYIKERGLILKA